MKVVILAGGYGTRIRDVADNIPKPMIKVGDKPIIWHIMKYYSSFGFVDFVICLGYRGDVIKDYFYHYELHISDFHLNLGDRGSLKIFENHDEKDWNITFAETGLDSMTGSRMKQIKKYIPENESFLLTYGDGLCDVDLNELIGFHKNHKKCLTLTGVRPAGRFGEIIANQNGEIVDFIEKPQVTEGRINGGYFVCNYDLFNYIEDGSDVIFENTPVKKLVSKGQLMQFNHDGFWQPMDTFREYTLLNRLYTENSAPWKKW